MEEIWKSGKIRRENAKLTKDAFVTYADATRVFFTATNADNMMMTAKIS